ncbi:restriction endonuclease [Actinomadura sp. 7K507]|uniref:restriction endonuclease n=1 Tax=Actinomadura sp. 7K507 TaxID=2530365 RepID=UPI00104FC427|nr:restriction endonuclease [Actinomadura sp. 7K507]TDC88833.1 restriction endonuclease [Actinomadura sp. 7K507]
MTVLDHPVPFEELGRADLVLDKIYSGGGSGHIADDPLSRLLPGVGNQGGFRFVGSPARQGVLLAALYTTGAEPDWPDVLDPQTGLFTYFGDNRHAGKELHETPRRGNILLRDSFAWARESAQARARVPPFLLFEKVPATGRAIRFRGLLAPGGAALTADDKLQAIWRSTDGQRFQNYRARFTVLDVAAINRAWIDQLKADDPLGSECPQPWRDWVNGRAYSPLLAPSTTVIRSKKQQLPTDSADRKIIEAIHGHFSERWHDFEYCATELWRMFAPATGKCEVTQRSRDGGRDALGEYLLGPLADQVTVEFALEAKCYEMDSAIGVKEVSRLISRIRSRQFGVFVSTSYFNQQVYKEVREDGHPIVLVCARDIVDVMRSHGYGTVADVQAWLDQRFPPAPAHRGSRALRADGRETG